MIADAFASALQTHLTATTPGVTVERVYVPVIDDDGFDAWLASSTSMRAYVVPVSRKTETATRLEDYKDYGLAVIFVEKYDAAGLPSKAWTDARVELVEGCEETLGDARNPLTVTNIQVWPTESEISLIFDADVMIENRAFWAVWNLTLRELN